MQNEMPRIRLFKGAYKEPPDLAFPKKADVDANFDLWSGTCRCARECGAPCLSADGRIPPIPAFGTHDQKRIQFAKDYALRWACPNRRWNSRCSTVSAAICRTSVCDKGTPVRSLRSSTVRTGTLFYASPGRTSGECVVLCLKFLQKVSDHLKAIVYFLWCNIIMVEGSLALVTGAAHRLGRIFALTLAQHGFAIVTALPSLCCAAASTAQEIRALGGQVYPVEADLTDGDQIQALFSKVDALIPLEGSG